jgi:hypothetical protein
MARWKLNAPHYLNVAGTTWEYKEVDRSTGKQIRKTFDVPTLLEPENPGDWNYVTGKDQGEIIVSDGKNAEPKDIIFAGKPTPDMVPLDDEARAITAAMGSKWNRTFEQTTGNSYAEGILDDLTKHGQPDPTFPSRDIEDYIIVVTDAPGVNQRDVVFEGKPTPGMLPLDDEAKAITAQCSKGIWKPTPGTDDDSQRASLSNQIIDELMGQMNTIKDEVRTAPAIEGMNELIATMTAMMKQNSEIIGLLAKQSAEGKRRAA